DDWLRFLERRERRAAVAARDRFLDLAYAAAQLGAACLVDLGPPHDLASGLAGRSGIGHVLCLDRKKTSDGEHLAASHAYNGLPLERQRRGGRFSGKQWTVRRCSTRVRRRAQACLSALRSRGSGSGWPAGNASQLIIGSRYRGLLACREGGQRRLDPRPGRIAMDMRDERLDARNQPFAIQHL